MEHENELPDLLTDEELSDILYCIGMESPTGYHNMAALCHALGIEFPPKKKELK